MNNTKFQNDLRRCIESVITITVKVLIPPKGTISRELYSQVLQTFKKQITSNFYKLFESTEKDRKLTNLCS